MKHFYKKFKKYALILMMLFCMAFVVQQSSVPAYGYTQEEKDAAKAWLSAHGYSPDVGGAYAAYADYMNGKFGAIPGLPEPNVKPEQSPAPEDTPVTQPKEDEDEEQEDKPKQDAEDDKEDETPEASSGELTSPQPPAEGEPETDLLDEADKANGQSDDQAENATESTADIPDLVLPNASQQEFADMIDVFVSEFSEDEQEEINKAKERLEKQKQERAAAEREAEGIKQGDHTPKKNVILILCGVLAVAMIGLVVMVVKKKRR